MKKHLLSFILLISCLSGFSQVIIPKDSLKKHVYFLASDSLNGRGLSTPSGLKAAHYIADNFKKAGIQPLGKSYLHPFYHRTYSTMLTGHNVVGVIEGSDSVLKHEYIVLGAHFDHIAYEFNREGEKVIYNGADDNATGTATVIELGRALAEHKDSLKRSVIIIAFDGEESGLIGSTELVRQEFVPIRDVKVMMSIDMVGRYKESGHLIMGAVRTLQGGQALLEFKAHQRNVKLKRTSDEVSSRTDSKPFGDKGIPAFHVTTGIIGPYHQPEDDRETIDFEGMEKVAGLLFDFTVALANEGSLEATEKFVSYSKNKRLPIFRYGFKTNMGKSYHHYPNEHYNGKGKFAYELGFMTQLRINRFVALQPEILYSSLASEYTLGNYRSHSFTTPVLLELSIPFDKDVKQRGFIHLGAFYRYHFYGSSNKIKLDYIRDFNQTETGLVYGLGVEFYGWQLSLNFSHGLSNLTQINGNPEFRNRAVFFGLNYFM